MKTQWLAKNVTRFRGGDLNPKDRKGHGRPSMSRTGNFIFRIKTQLKEERDNPRRTILVILSQGSSFAKEKEEKKEEKESKKLICTPNTPSRRRPANSRRHRSLLKTLLESSPMRKITRHPYTGIYTTA